MGENTVSVAPLGQAGFRLEFPGLVLYIDPYLSHSVEAAEGSEMARRVPVPIVPEAVADADWILITHLHLDHCDPETLRPISLASPDCRFLCPNEARPVLASLGIAEARLVAAEEAWLDLSPRVRVRSVLAVHPTLERDDQQLLRCVGYLLDDGARRLYHAGDTSVAQELLDALKSLGPIDVAFLPVNERNFFRDRRGILGNMSVREAFLMTEEIGARTLVAMHWDMFAPNSAFQEELDLLYRLIQPPFRMLLNPRTV